MTSRKSRVVKLTRFHDQEIEIYNGRVFKEDRDPNKCYYETRHGSLDWNTPLTIEKRVFVDFCNTIACQKPLALEEHGINGHSDKYIDLTPYEQELLRD